jgi:hypothetical protein
MVLHSIYTALIPWIKAKHKWHCLEITHESPTRPSAGWKQVEWQFEGSK